MSAEPAPGGRGSKLLPWRPNATTNHHRTLPTFIPLFPDGQPGFPKIFPFTPPYPRGHPKPSFYTFCPFSRHPFFSARESRFFSSTRPKNALFLGHQPPRTPPLAAVFYEDHPEEPGGRFPKTLTVSLKPNRNWQEKRHGRRQGQEPPHRLHRRVRRHRHHDPAAAGAALSRPGAERQGEARQPAAERDLRRRRPHQAGRGRGRREGRPQRHPSRRLSRSRGRGTRSCRPTSSAATISSRRRGRPASSA